MGKIKESKIKHIVRGKKATIFHNEKCARCHGSGFLTEWIPAGSEAPPIGVLEYKPNTKEKIHCPICKGRGCIEYSEEIEEIDSV